MSEETQGPKKKSFEAIPIQDATLQKAGIEVTELPVAKFPTSAAPKNAAAAPASNKEPKRTSLPSGDDAKRGAVERTPVPRAQTTAAQTARSPVAETRPPAAEAPTEPAPTRTKAFQQPPTPPKKEEASVNRKALEKTNRGKRPSSRRFIRGILHPSALKVSSAAFFAIAVRVVLLGAVVLGGLILFGQVEPWFAWFLLILPVVALLHFATVGGARCRVCGIKEFVPSAAHKHVKTHNLLFFGPIVSTALHLLLFKWFHCMFCGTAIRIKK